MMLTSFLFTEKWNEIRWPLNHIHWRTCGPYLQSTRDPWKRHLRPALALIPLISSRGKKWNVNLFRGHWSKWKSRYWRTFWTKGTKGKRRQGAVWCQVRTVGPDKLRWRCSCCIHRLVLMKTTIIGTWPWLETGQDTSVIIMIWTLI